MQESGASTTKSSTLPGSILLVGGLCALIAIVVFSVFVDRTPTLDPGSIEEWKARWNREGPVDYDLSISIQVDREDASRAKVTVREGELVSQTYNGLSRASTDDSYTVAGLFRTMERELELSRQAEQKGGTVLKAVFEESLGAPLLFKRLTTRPGGRSVVITVIELSSPKAGILFPAGEPR
jgi:hypothetical protein